MRVLLIAQDFPYPPLDGYRLFTYHMLRELRPHCAFDIVSFRGDTASSNMGELAPYANDVTLLPPKQSRGWALWKRRITARFSFLPSNVFWVRSASMRCLVQQRIQARKYDLAYLNAPALAWYARDVFPCIPTVIAPLDARCRQVPQLAQMTRNPVLRFHAYEQWLKSRYYESRYYSLSDACVVVSDRDRQSLLSIAPSLPIRVVPLGVDIDHFVPVQRICSEYDLAFSGNLGYAPNNDAAMMLVKSILPALRSVIPSLRLALIGAHADAQLLREAALDPDTVITGYVDDIAGHITRSQVYVCPVRYGTGMRVKILEAMSAGMPIVTYPVNVEELPVRHGEHLMVADTEEQFIAYTLRLLQNADLRISLGQRARNLIVAQFSWHQAALKLLETLLEAKETGLNRLNQPALPIHR